VIGSLRGTVVDRSGDGEVIVEVAGVGYRLAVTPATVAAVGEPGSDVFLHVHHHVTDDSQRLYGFTSIDERRTFEALIGAHGVGPSLALAVLGVHTPTALRLALAADDLDALCLVPGVGRKTATRLLIELKSRLDLAERGDELAVVARNGSAGPAPSPHADVRAALAELGYGAEEIRAVVAELPADGDSAGLLRQALQRLATF
jgi:Holliday junction DNA helicase RuvA